MHALLLWFTPLVVSNQAWKPSVPLPRAREYGAAAAFPGADGAVVVVGGVDENHTPLGDTLIFKPSAKTGWKRGPALPIASYFAAAASFSFAANASGASASAAPVGGGGAGGAGTMVDAIVVAGGCTGGSCATVADVYMLKSTNLSSWTAVAPMTTPRRGFGLVGMNNAVYAVGGNDAYSNCLHTAERYLGGSSWTTIANMSTARFYVALAASSSTNALYAVGGYDGVSTLRTAEMYNPSTDKWSRMAPMLSPRDHMSSAVLGGMLYVIGGFNGEKTEKSTEIFDVAAGKWKLGPSLAAPRDNYALAVATYGGNRSRRSSSSSVGGGALYVLGGFGSANAKQLKTVEVLTVDAV